MQPNRFVKAGLLCLFLVIGFIAAWEWYWRNKGFPPSYNDDEALWAEQRALVYSPKENTTVFIGSSRIKFDLDIPTWEKLTGENAVQLSMVGTNPRPLLDDLANDEEFRGKLIIDITEPLFFSPAPVREKSARDGIAYYKDYTPAQKFSSLLNYGLESNLVFLEKERFGLNALLKDLEIPNREEVRERPVFVKEFGLTQKSRQAYMTERFLSDTSLQNRQTAAWLKTGAMSRAPGVGGDTLTKILQQVKSSVDKIRSRGGTVLFVRTPSSGGYLETENFVYPRQKYWDAMLLFTKTEGIHFKDYPATQNMICPEWSHLSSKDAVIYTRELVRILAEEKGWRFRTTPSLAKN